MASTSEEPRPRTLARALLLLAVAVAAVVLPAVGSDLAPSAAQAAPERSVTVTPDTELHGWDQVTVRWSGFPPNQPVTISQYGSSGVTARWNRVPAYTGPDGSGEAVLTIGLGSSCFGPNGSCRIVVGDCASRAADGSWGYTFFQEPSGPGWASTAIGIAEPAQEDPDTGELTNPAIAAPPAPPPPPPEERGPLPTITRPAPSAVTGSAQADLVEAWRDEVLYGAGTSPFTFDFTPINTPSAVEELVAGSIDFAVTGSTPTAEQLTALEAAGRPVVAVPVAADGLVIVHDRGSVPSPDSTGFDLRTISPKTVASLFELSGGGTDDINEALTADNRGCDMSTLDVTLYRFTRFIYRADRSATNHLLLSWLKERGLRSAEPSAVIDLGQGSFTGVNGGDEVVSRFIRRTGEGEGGDEVYRRIGYVSRSTATREGLAMFDIALPDGQFVRPTDASIVAALTGRPVDPATAIDTDLTTTAPGTWPLSYLHYALVPKYPSGTVTPDELAVIRDLLAHGLSAAGQATAAERGYTPLPPEVLALAQERAATITLEPPVAPAAPGSAGPDGAGSGTFGTSPSGPLTGSSGARPPALNGGFGGLGADAAAAPSAEQSTSIVATRQSRPFILGQAGLVPSLVVIMSAGLLAVVLGCLPRARARATAAARAVRERTT